MQSRLASAAVLAGALIATNALLVAPNASADPQWTMPNLIGQDLQGAQDAIQSLTGDQLWYTASKDLTGKGRNQVLDRSWQVCSSMPPPGSTITPSTQITFGVVRIDTETCP